MKAWLGLVPFVAALAGVGFWLGAPHSTPPTPEPAPDRAAAVRAVFQSKCTGCHGPDLPKPQGRFGYVLDLKRLAADREKVIPGRPAESELWALVEHDEMPPSDSPHGPLTPSQKETIRDWIAAGSPE
jgi:mono/diheme cytochrome c family protein